MERESCQALGPRRGRLHVLLLAWGRFGTGWKHLCAGTQAEAERGVGGLGCMVKLSSCLNREEGTMFFTSRGIAVSMVSGHLNVWCGFVCACVCVLNIKVDNEVLRKQ